MRPRTLLGTLLLGMAAAGLMLLAACGQKGDLYLPEQTSAVPRADSTTARG
ncbi:MAG: lipoprotein [Gammaproteobacteria bacterium]